MIVAIKLPAAAMPVLENYVEKSGLTADAFYRAALNLGVRINSASLAPLGDLSWGLHIMVKHKSQQKIPPETIYTQIAGKSPESDMDLSKVATLRVDIEPDLMKTFEKEVERTRVPIEDYLATAFGTGVQILVSLSDSAGPISFEDYIRLLEGRI